jgi:hypothetical protein
MTFPQLSETIFLWHHPADIDFVRGLAENLRSRGLETIFNDPEIETGSISAFSVEWRMSKSNCVIFILSEQATKTPQLSGDVRKVMRRHNAIAVPALLDDEGVQNMPPLLRFIEPLDFRGDYEKALMDLVDLARMNVYGQPETGKNLRLFFMKPIYWLIDHFKHYLILRPLTFCWRITVENLIVSLAVTGLILFYFQPEPRTNIEGITASAYLWLVIILSPILETVLLQAFPVFIARSLGLKFSGQILLSIIPFALLHFTRSVGTGIGAGIIGGFYSAFTYVHWRSKSLWTAYWVTALSHGLYNLAVFAMIIGEF